MAGVLMVLELNRFNDYYGLGSLENNFHRIFGEYPLFKLNIIFWKVLIPLIF